MGEARRRGHVLGLKQGRTEADLSVGEEILYEARRRHAMVTRAKAEAQVALELERQPESPPEALPDPQAAERQLTVAKVAGYRDRRILEDMAASEEPA